MDTLNCKHKKSVVIDSRLTAEGRRRRRKCNECGYKFSTIEETLFKLKPKKKTKPKKKD